MYSQIHVSDFEQLYREINITNFGRIIAYLAYVYKQSESEELFATMFEGVLRNVESLIFQFF